LIENLRPNLGLLGLVCLIAWAAGCGRSAQGPGHEAAEAEHIRKVPGLVAMYVAAVKKQPASIEEVRDWAVKEGKASESDFTSTRDNEPYGIANSPMGYVVYEKTGKNGKCYLMRMGGVTEVPADEAKRLANENPMRETSGKPKKSG